MEGLLTGWLAPGTPRRTPGLEAGDRDLLKLEDRLERLDTDEYEEERDLDLEEPEYELDEYEELLYERLERRRPRDLLLFFGDLPFAAFARVHGSFHSSALGLPRPADAGCLGGGDGILSSRIFSRRTISR